MAKTYRPIENIKRDVAGAEKWLSELRRELQSAERSARMKAMRNHPDFIAKMNAGLTELQTDPERRAQWIAKKRIRLNRPCILPPMTARQKRYYLKLRSAKVPRLDAVQAALHIEAAQ